MRSHVTPLPPSPHKAAAEEEDRIEKESASSSSASEEAEAEEEEVEGMEEDEGKSLYYGLRENPRKSFRVVDPEFVDAAGFVVQDRESETESSRKNAVSHHRRSKRQRRSVDSPSSELTPKFKLKCKPEQEPEPLSSVSDTTPEEDVALCLMMLSRDIWMRDGSDADSEEENYEEDRRAGEAEEVEGEEEEAEELKFRRRRRSKYQCGTCKKVFRSYQALGGHRASHKKIRGCSTPTVPSPLPTATNGRDSIPDNVGPADQHRIHQCPVCLRVFRSGQALGGHKRSHVTGSASASISVSVSLSVSGSASFVDAAPPPTPAAKLADNFIDLNLPAPVDDDDVMSVVSDAEFVDIPK